jgi:hypothetical protein
VTSLGHIRRDHSHGPRRGKQAACGISGSGHAVGRDLNETSFLIRIRAEAARSGHCHALQHLDGLHEGMSREHALLDGRRIRAEFFSARYGRARSTRREQYRKQD